MQIFSGPTIHLNLHYPAAMRAFCDHEVRETATNHIELACVKNPTGQHNLLLGNERAVFFVDNISATSRKFFMSTAIQIDEIKPLD